MDLINYHIIPYLDLLDIFHLCVANKENYQAWDGDVMKQRKREWKLKKGLEIDFENVEYPTDFFNALETCGYEKYGNIWKWTFPNAKKVMKDHFSNKNIGLKYFDRIGLYKPKSSLEIHLLDQFLKGNKFIHQYQWMSISIYWIELKTIKRFHFGDLKVHDRTKNILIMCIIKEWF